MRAFLLNLLLCGLLASGRAAAAEVQVFAAASLSDALAAIARLYEAETGAHVSFNFAASSVLARQIQEGARADLFLSADTAKVDQLAARGLIVPGSRVRWLSNTLVIVVRSGEKTSFAEPRDLLKAERIALAETSTVPAGIYARRFLEEEDLWDALKDRIVPTGNVRGALAAVESGNVDAAIVYRTDVAAARRVRVAYEIPAEKTPGIIYEAALLQEGRNQQEAAAFLRHVQGTAARAILQKHGFILLP